MTIELRPMGVACNLKCTYCYQEPVRQAGNIHTKYNIEAMLAEADRVGQKFNLFGGEALLVPKKDLETIFAHGFNKFKENGLQTNGTLIDDDHIAMFKKYNVKPGISVDGPGELNRLRWAGSEDKTVAHTKKTIENIQKLIDNGIRPGIIITLHRVNASAEKLDELISFIRWLGDIGVTGGNIHSLEVDKTMPNQDIHVLSEEENIHAMLKLAAFFDKNRDLRWNPFSEYPRMVMGNDKDTTCYWNSCDPGNTQAVYGIEGDGSLSNCGRTNKEGIDWYKADRNSYARYISFYYTPDEMGGCQGCRFWMACGGNCPGEAIDGDFRNKTTHCGLVKAILTHYENREEAQGRLPVTKSPQRPAIEKIMLDRMAQGRRIRIHECLDIINQNFGREMIQLPVISGEEARA